MGAAARRGDKIQTNHDGDEYTEAEGCSTDCFINGKGVPRYGDQTALHRYRGKKHTVPLVKASAQVFINGKGAGMVGSEYGDNEVVIGGSPDTFFG